MAKARDVWGIRWVVTWQYIVAIAARTNFLLVICDVDTSGAVRADIELVCAASITACGGCEGFSLRTFLLNCDVGARIPDLIGLLRIPSEAQNVITFGHIGYVNLVHNAKIEVVPFELLIVALDLTTSTSTGSETIQSWNGWLEGWT